MNKSNSATFETAEMTVCPPLAIPTQASGQVYGYIQPYRFYKAGKRVLVYRLPGAARPLTVLKPLVYLTVLLLAAFATGYVNGGHAPKHSGGRTVPTAVLPNITFHRLITTSAVRGAINLPVNTFLRKYPSVREMT